MCNVWDNYKTRDSGRFVIICDNIMYCNGDYCKSQLGGLYVSYGKSVYI